MSSIYHLIDKPPTVNFYDLSVEYEKLANRLINSGKLRIDTDFNVNFARFNDPRIDVSFMVSDKEIADPNLFSQLQLKLKKLYSVKYTGSEVDNKVNQAVNNIKLQLQKLIPVSDEKMLMLARLLVQAAHPIVIEWLLIDHVEVFISYSHNIGDMMDIVNWRTSGSNSGMQSTDGKNIAVFVSCGGDPFEPNNEPNHTYGNGFAAVARMQIIAGQELGHFADIMRNSYGQQIDRHSTNFSITQAKPSVKTARQSDIINCKELYNELLGFGLAKLINFEETLKFYRNNKIFGIRNLYVKSKIWLMRKIIMSKAKKFQKYLFLNRFYQDDYPALLTKTMFIDMQFNLAPEADVYNNSNPEIKEAIACAEALARVPQQALKWGHLATMVLMENLYKIYYNEVIPSLINNYESFTGLKFTRYLETPKKSFRYRIKKFFGYLNEVRFKIVRIP